jgi:hypothetical protein
MTFTSQCITYEVNGQTLALDYSQALAAGAPDPATGVYYQGVQLLPLSGAPGQVWSYQQLANSFALTADNLGWFGLDGRSLWLSPPWDDASSTGNIEETTNPDGTVTFGYGGNILRPSADGTGVEMAPPPSGWAIVAPPVTPPVNDSTDATVIPGLPVAGLQGAWSPTNQAFDSDYWLAFLSRPPIDATGAQNCIVMANGIGIQGDWTQFGGDAYYSGQVAQQSNSIANPGAKQWFAIPLGAFPPSSGSLAEAGTGAFNQHYANAASQFGAVQGRVLWRLMWEGIAQRNDWYPWGYDYPGSSPGTYAADFVAAWNQMAQSVLPILPGELVWNLNQDFLACPVWQECWPQGQYRPSIVAVDVYYQGWMGPVGPDGGLGVFNQYHLPGLEEAAAFALEKGARFAIAEWGIQNGDAPGWVAALGQFISSLEGETVTINDETLPLYVYNGAYLVGADSIVNCPNALTVYSSPPFAL